MSSDALVSLFERTGFALRLTRLRRAAVRIAAASGVLFAAVTGAGAFGLRDDVIGAVLWLAGAITVAGGIALAWRALRVVTHEESARRLDDQFGLKDAMSSAAAFLSNPRPEPLERLHLARMAVTAARLSAPHGLVGDRPWRVVAVVSWVVVVVLHATPTSRPFVSSSSADERDPQTLPAADDSRPTSIRETLPAAAKVDADDVPDTAAPGSEATHAAHRPPGGVAAPDARVSGADLSVAALGGGDVSGGDAGGPGALAAREDLARALSDLFTYSPSTRSESTSEAGVGLPESGNGRRVESPRGGSEAGRTHLAIDERGGLPQREVAAIRQDGADGSMLAPPLSEGRWLPSRTPADTRSRSMPVPAAMGGDAGAAAPSGRASEGQVEGAFEARDSSPPLVVSATHGVGMSLAGRSGHKQDRRGRPVPTSFESPIVPLQTFDAAGPAGREAVRELDGPASSLVSATREYALFLNRSRAP